MPAAQMPGWPVAQAPPPPGSPSSTAPLQSLSSPSHDLGARHDVLVAVRWWRRCSWVVPAEQTPGTPVAQAWLPPGLPSSMLPLQLSSMPLQVSALGDRRLHAGDARRSGSAAVPARRCPGCRCCTRRRRRDRPRRVRRRSRCRGRRTPRVRDGLAFYCMHPPAVHVRRSFPGLERRQAAGARHAAAPDAWSVRRRSRRRSRHRSPGPVTVQGVVADLAPAPARAGDVGASPVDRITRYWR